MKVLVVGGYGCGTTGVYNIARELFKAVFIRVHALGASQADIEADDLFNSVGNLVVKSHDAKLQTHRGIRVLLCVRDVYDAAASIHRRRSDEQILLNTIRVRREVEQWYKHRPHVARIAYEVNLQNHDEMVAEISRFLGFNIAPERLEQVAAATSIDRAKQLQQDLTEACPITELRPDHVGPDNGRPGAGAKLSSQLRAEIKHVYEGGGVSSR